MNSVSSLTGIPAPAMTVFWTSRSYKKKKRNSSILLLTKKYIFEINSSFISKRPSDTFEAKEHIKTEFVKVLKGPRKVAALI